MEKSRKRVGSGIKKWAGVCLLVFSILVFVLCIFPSFLGLGDFFLGLFGVMAYPLSILLALVGIANILGLRYTFDTKFTVFMAISLFCIIGLLHTIFCSKALMQTYNSISKMGAYLSATYHMTGGVTIAGIIMSIIVFLLRSLLGVGGTYVVFAVLATLFVGISIDYAVHHKIRKQKQAKSEPAKLTSNFDEKSGLSTDEYSFKKQDTAYEHNFGFEGETSEVAKPDISQNLFEEDASLDFSFAPAEEEQKTQNSEQNYAKSVLFGENEQKNNENEPNKESEEPKSARDILFGDAPKIPNIFDRSSEERDAWRKEYSSRPLEFKEEKLDNKEDDGVVKTSWGEYRPTAPISKESSVEDASSTIRRDNGIFGRDVSREISRDRTFERPLSSDRPIAENLSRDASRVVDRNSRLEDRAQNSEPNEERIPRRDLRERTSLSNFNRQSEVSENNDVNSRLSSDRRGGDILANASSLGIEMKETPSNFGSIVDASRQRTPIREERPAPRENLARALNQKYTPPPTNILTVYKEEHEDYSEEYRQKSEILESTLKAFKIPAKVVNVVRGPKVTRYELTMPTGIPVSKILSYDKDISMNLATKSGVRIEAPIPGKNAFGVEVENAKSSMVGMRELVESPEFINFKKPLAVAVGKNISGEVIIKSLSNMVHMLVAGSTGSGKSVFLHSLIISLMYKYSPEELRFIMIDPKRVEFPRYNGMPHLMLPEVVNECSKAVNALTWAVKEMERRYSLLEKYRCQKLEQYNECQAVKNGEEKKLPYLVIVVDELAELMSVAKKEVEARIQRITQLGRAAGIHMVLATQRPSVDIITGVIKNNLPTRVALSLASAIDSMTVINQGGAEKLLGHGDMLLSAQDSNQVVRLQGAFVSDEEIDKVINFVKAHCESVFDEEVQKSIYAEPEKEEDKDDDSSSSNEDRMDELMPQALKLVMKNGKASISMVQRRFSVGYARAARIIDQMETHGFIDGGLGNKPRDVKITMEEYNQLFGDFDAE